MKPGHLIAVAIAGCACVFSLNVAAENTGLYAKVGTLGIGAEAGYAFNQSFGVRLGYNTWSYRKDRTENGVDYDAKLSLKSVEFLGEWHPFQGIFRVDAGLVANRNKFELNAKPTNGTFTFNGQTYSASQVGSASGDVSFRNLAPYLGIGWSTSARKGFTLSSDIGVLFQGKPKTTLNVVCGTGVSCSQLQSDAAAEQAKVDDALDEFRYYPVFSIGIGYRF